jgi:hypothetical protein
MIRKVKLFVESLFQEGLLTTLQSSYAWIKTVFSIQGVLSAIKLYESQQFKERAGSLILAGPFAGVLLEKLNWGRRDFIAYSGGIYEQEVLSYFVHTKGQFKTFIDIGAADGYYAVSTLKNDFFEYVHAFEKSSTSREIIRFNAQRNQVSHKLNINGKFDISFEKYLGMDFDWESTLILSDIEGAEFELFDSELLSEISGAHILIELHKRNRSDVEIQKFQELLAEFNVISFIKSDERNVYKFADYNPMSEDLRYLMSSDGRTRDKNDSRLLRGEWILCCPNESCRICCKTV